MIVVTPPIPSDVLDRLLAIATGVLVRELSHDSQEGEGPGHPSQALQTTTDVTGGLRAAYLD